MNASNFALPQVLGLRISNMTTFPSEIKIEFSRGVNVIFGGNHSGKTTIVNSIKYSIFGLSWNQNSDGLEGRYFSNRINEAKRKSLEITAIYKIKPKITTTKRTIYSSGKADIKSSTSKGSNKSLSESGETIESEENYKIGLREDMGLIFSEQAKFIPNLIFADENRQPILWTNDVESLVTSLLISKQSADKIRILDSQLYKTKIDLEKLDQKRDQLLRKKSNDAQITALLKSSLKDVESEFSNKNIEQEYNDAKEELTKCKNRISELNNELQNELISRSKIQTQLSDNQSKLISIKQEQELLTGKLLKAFLNPDDPISTHLGRVFYYDKVCPFCASDLSSEIQSRIETRKCPICGQGELSSTEVDLDETNQRLSKLDLEKEGLAKLNKDIQLAINKSIENIDAINKKIENERKKESVLLKSSDRLKNLEETVHKKKIMTKEIEDWEKQIKNIEELIAKNDLEIGIIRNELDKIKELSNRTKEATKNETSNQLAKIAERFSDFIFSATNGELSCRFTPDFMPVLNGRIVFFPEQCSQFERAVMDIAFRIAFLSVFAELTDSTPTIVLETPDEVTDEAYIPYFSDALVKYSSNLSIVVTTVRTLTMERLLGKTNPKERLVNLISKGTLTQRKFYELPLQAFLSGTE